MVPFSLLCDLIYLPSRPCAVRDFTRIPGSTEPYHAQVPCTRSPIPKTLGVIRVKAPHPWGSAWTSAGVLPSGLSSSVRLSRPDVGSQGSSHRIITAWPAGNLDFGLMLVPSEMRTTHLRSSAP